jgi:hypothetical protein
MMNKSDKQIFKSRIKATLKKKGSFSRDEIALVLIIFEALFEARHKYAMDAAAGRYQFEFAERAAAKYKTLTAAISLFERIVTCPIHGSASRS